MGSDLSLLRYVKKPPLDDQTISPMERHWSKWHWWLYVLMILASASALGDAYLPPVRVDSTIQRSTPFEVSFSDAPYHVRFSSKRKKIIEQWAVVTMANGSKFQIHGDAALFPPGDTIMLELTPLWKEVARYRRPAYPQATWTELSSRNKEYDAFPAGVLICALLLLVPFRTVQPRWYLHGILLLLTSAWLVTIIGLGALKPWG